MKNLRLTKFLRFDDNEPPPMIDAQMRDYYNQRAASYEQVYLKPERQGDLRRLTVELQSRLSDRSVLEIAAGTGYWTERLAPTARNILAIDQSEETLKLAQFKTYPLNNVSFLQADAYRLDNIATGFTAGFAGFWWSHIPRSQIESFLQVFHSKLQPGSTVIFVDNCWLPGSSTAISRTDTDGNRYQMRTLPDGTQHEVLKNFPTDSELAASVSRFAVDFEILRLPAYWLMQYRI